MKGNLGGWVMPWPAGEEKKKGKRSLLNHSLCSSDDPVGQWTDTELIKEKLLKRVMVKKGQSFITVLN